LLRLGEVSELRSSGQIDRIIRALRAYAEGTWFEAGELSGEGAPSFGATAAVWSYFCRLGLDEHFSSLGDGRRSKVASDTVFSMVANRLTDPASKRRTITEWLSSVALPTGVRPPGLDQCYRAVDTVSQAKQATEVHLYEQLCNLTNLDLRLVCYDITSSYFETVAVGQRRFSSLAFGYSRDHRSDRPQIVIGLLVTGDGIPIAHHVFSGNTSDVSTLPGVMEDLQARFGVGRIALVADRGLISEDNLDEVAARGFEHVLATRLHHDDEVASVLEQAISKDTDWTAVPEARCFCAEITHNKRRFVVVFSPVRFFRDRARHRTLCAKVEDGLIALEARVRAGRLSDPAKIGAAADRILRDSGVGRCFKITVGKGSFSWDFDEKTRRYDEELLCGRYVITTSLDKDEVPAAQVVRYYRSLLNVEHRFRVLKDFLELRPIFHWTEERVRGHVALCVMAATIEAVMAKDLMNAKVMDPDLPFQSMTPRRALSLLKEIRLELVSAGDHNIELVSRRSPLQVKVLKALKVDTSTWDKAAIA
ncbi:MAG: IS1634 family transposase, partial [Acidimicrobiales bacterium]